MDIIFTARDYGYNIEEFLSNLNENSSINNDAIEFLEKYVNDNIRYIYDVNSKTDYEALYNEAETTEDEQRIDKKQIKDVMSSVDRFKSDFVKEVKKWMRYVVKNPHDDTINYMFRSQEAAILDRFLKDIHTKDIITLEDVQMVLENDLELKNFLQQVNEEYQIIKNKELDEENKKYDEKVKLKNKNDEVLLRHIMIDLGEDHLLNLEWNKELDKEKLRVIKRLIKPFFKKLMSVTSIEEALQLNNSLFKGKLGRFLYSQMKNEKEIHNIINIQLNILARIISYFIDDDYNLLYLNISKDYYTDSKLTTTSFKENELTPLIDEVKFAIQEYLPSHKLFDERGDFHNVRIDINNLIKDKEFSNKRISRFTPLAMEILHSALIHLFGTNNEKVKFGGNTRKIFTSFMEQVDVKDKKDASTMIRAIITDPKYKSYFNGL